MQDKVRPSEPLVPPSKSLRLVILLAFSGGLMDAYSYLGRGGVFANAQTGNIVLLGVHLTAGNFSAILTYLVPILAFSLGIAAAALLRIRFQRARRVHWRQIVVLMEALLFALVAFLPQDMNLIANSLISLACGAQVEAFRKVGAQEYGIATTMCIGNLRTGVQALSEFAVFRKRDLWRKACYSFLVILSFALGAVLCGNLLLHHWEELSILTSTAIMLIAFWAMRSRG